MQAHDRKLNYSNSLELLDQRTQLEFNENRNSASKNHAYIMKNAKNCLKNLIFLYVSIRNFYNFCMLNMQFFALFSMKQSNFMYGVYSRSYKGK